MPNVMHRVYVCGETYTYVLHEQNKVISRNFENIALQVIGNDFSSLYPSVLLLTKHEFNKYSGRVRYMSASFVRTITDKKKCRNLSTSNSRFSSNPNYAFKARVKLGCPPNKINNFINFTTIFRQTAITKNEQTRGTYMKRNDFVSLDEETDILT